MKKFLKLWEGCRMMNVCGVNIIGCPDHGKRKLLPTPSMAVSVSGLALSLNPCI